MSSAETGPARVTLSRRSLVRGLSLLLAVAPALAGCAAAASSPSTARRLPARACRSAWRRSMLRPIPGRVGQRIRNELIFQSSGGGELLPPTHRLEVSITESVLSTLVKIDGDVARPDLCHRGHLQG